LIAAASGRRTAIVGAGIVGAGIVGLAHVLAAARRGDAVTVFERDAREAIPQVAAWLAQDCGAFVEEPAIAALCARVARETPALLERGIPLVVQQVGDHGDLIVGDSHRHDETPPPFASQAIGDLLVSLAQETLGRPLEVRERWQGVYASGPRPCEVLRPAPGVTALVVTSGIGMSVAFALAERPLPPGASAGRGREP
jgi:hypothetical protein